MPEAKHTPGPWSMIGSTVYVLNGQKPPCNTFYATVQPGVGDDGRYIGSLEVIANANLMAAAPDLLGALENLIDAYSKPDDRICCNGIDCGCMGATNRHLAEHYAKEAIARAKGEPLNPA